jgi:hypothetical protein
MAGSTSAIRGWILALDENLGSWRVFGLMKTTVLVVEDAKLSLIRPFSVVAEDYRGGRLHRGYTRLQHTEPDAVSRSDCERQIRPRCSLAARRFSDSECGLSASACTLKPAQEWAAVRVPGPPPRQPRRILRPVSQGKSGQPE